MRIVLCTAQYPPTTGGVERYNAALADTLAALGHTVVVATSGWSNRLVDEAEAGVTVMRLPAWPLLGGRYPLPRLGSGFRSGARQLWAEPIDLMVINTRFWALSLWATQACRRRRTPAIVLEHGSGYLSLGGRVVDLAVRAYEHVALWWVRHYCQLFYGVSEATCDWLRQLGVSPQGVLYNAVDVAAVTGLAARCDWDVRDDLGLDPATPVIAFAGRLIAGKGINELVAAMAMVRQTRPDAVLVAAGDGPLLESLNDASKPGVIFLGALPHERTLALIQQSDVFCLPTYSEGFSTVILEAAALGACIVTTPVGGTPELIASPTAGVLLEDVRPATIATALHRVLGDKAWRQQAGAECQARVEAAFTWERTANAVLGIAKALAPDNFEGEATTPRH